MKLQCKRCRYRWEYRGSKDASSGYPVYVSCPRCRTLVKLIEKTII